MLKKTHFSLGMASLNTRSTIVDMNKSHVLSYGGEEHPKDSFEILTGEGFEWKAAEGGNVPEWAFQVSVCTLVM